MVSGTPGRMVQYSVYNEGKHLMGLSYLRKAIAVCFACYYIFNISYPKSDNIFLSYVFNIEALDNPPPTLARLVHSIPK